MARSWQSVFQQVAALRASDGCGYPIDLTGIIGTPLGYQRLNTVLTLRVTGQGLHDVTQEVVRAVEDTGVSEGLVTLFIQHTSASLLIQENYDESAKADLEGWLNRLVPENDELYTHTVEGPDDMPAHIKSALTAVSISIPLIDGRLGLGTYQGIFLWEHRHNRGERDVVVHVAADS